MQDDFAERIRSKELARIDQRDAAEDAARRQAEAEAMNFANARGDFNEMQGVARAVIESVNARITAKYVVM
jgi:hypothetical protein